MMPGDLGLREELPLMKRFRNELFIITRSALFQIKIVAFVLNIDEFTPLTETLTKKAVRRYFGGTSSVIHLTLARFDPSIYLVIN